MVYKARDTHLDRFLVIKALSAQAICNAESKRRFVREAKSASALDHPNIITVLLPNSSQSGGNKRSSTCQSSA